MSSNTIGCPKCGSEELGTNETIAATAHATLRRIGGRVEVEHEGYTDVAWDSSTTDEDLPYVCRECWCMFGDDDIKESGVSPQRLETE